MRLKQIEIHGFKSLARKTVLTFPGEVTCIAGPNGCGKSNIVDAIRWALGEQSPKSLRAGAMDDIIFSGTQEISASGMASVTLEFVRDSGYFPKSLDGFNEISISRRLYRTGESIYTLNGLRCRLKDIMDIFLDTGLGKNGYAIIEQGEIENIVQASPEDIRALIEEAAGISKFRVKKAEAIKRLEKTTHNLERINDLLSEISKQRDTLKSHANKAKRYQILRKEANELTQLLWSYEATEIKKQRDDHLKHEADINAQIKIKEDTIATFARQLEGFKKKAEEKKQEIDRLSDALLQTKSKLDITKRDIASGQDRLRNLQSTRDMLNSRSDQTQRYIIDIRKQALEEESALSKIKNKISHIETDIAKKQHSLDGLRVKYNEISRAYEQERTGLFDLIGHARAIDQRIASVKQQGLETNSNIKARGQELRDAITKRSFLRNETKLTKNEVGQLERCMEDIQGILGRLNKEKAEFESLIEQKSNGLFKIEKEYSAITAKAALLEDIISAAQSSTVDKNLMDNSLKRVSDIIRVKPGFEEAVGSSMGSIMDYVIITDYKQALKSIDKNIYPGFIPIHPHINTNKSSEMPKGDGMLGHLRSFIDVHKDFSDVLDVLTEDMWVIKDIDGGLNLWRKKERSCNMVTKDGIILEKTGVIRTAANNTRYVEILKAKTEKEALAIKKDSLTLKIKDIKEDLEDKKTKIASLLSKIQVLKKEATQKNTQLNIQRNKISSLQSQIDSINDKVAAFRQDINMWSELKKRLDRDLIDAKDNKNDLDCKTEEKQFQVRQLAKDKEDMTRIIEENQSDLQRYMMAIQELKISSASRSERLNRLKEQLKKEEATIEEDKKRLIDIDKNEDKIKEAISIHNTTIEKTHVEIKELEDLYNALLSGYNKTMERVATLSDTIHSLKKELSILEKERDEITLKYREKQIAFEMALQRMQNRFGEGILPIPSGFDIDDARQKIDRAQTRIERMGQINFTSIEAYEEVRSRWEDLNNQYQDLMLSSTRLKQVISNIERESTKEFRATFTSVKKNFSEIFTELFCGGKADLVIPNGDPMEGGVEIMASPPYKRLKRMTLLSGGEKSLCAVSLIFALFKAKPSAFCILDEVDASLDDANIDRFKHLIKRFSNKTQFIIVTHNKQTMSMADVIYGITFETPGASKVVSMDLEQYG